MDYYRSRNQEYMVAINISKERNMFVVAEWLLYDVTKTHDGHPVSNEMMAFGVHKHVNS